MHIATVVHDFRGGGAERVSVLLANAFARLDHRSEILCLQKVGPYLDSVLPEVTIRCFDRARMYAAIGDLARQFRSAPDMRVLSHLTHVNVVTLAAAALAGGTSVTCVEHNDFAKAAADTGAGIARLAYLAAPYLYPRAAAVISVSESVRASVPGLGGLPEERKPVVANPIDPDQLRLRAAEDPGHPWLGERNQTLVACGRLTRQKNYPMMLQSLARLRSHRDVKLIVLGVGPLRDDLQRQAESLGVADAVDFRGFSNNPFAFFSRCRLFVSTSDYEGLPMTMIEALYCGADLVTTDNCSDARRLSEGSGFGACTPIGNIDAFVAAVKQRLEGSIAPIETKQAALTPFAIDAVTARYLSVLGRDPG